MSAMPQLRVYCCIAASEVMGQFRSLIDHKFHTSSAVIPSWLPHPTAVGGQLLSPAQLNEGQRKLVIDEIAEPRGRTAEMREDRGDIANLMLECLRDELVIRLRWQRRSQRIEHRHKIDAELVARMRSASSGFVMRLSREVFET